MSWTLLFHQQLARLAKFALSELGFALFC